MPISSQQGAQIRQAYANGLSIRDIVRKFGTSRETAYVWIDGGPPQGADRQRPLPPLQRRQSSASPSIRPSKQPGRLAKPQRLRGKRSAVVKRLWRSAEAQVRDIERRLLRVSEDPGERERDARLLAVLAKTLRDLSALDVDDGVKAQHDFDDEGPRDLDEFRRDLARRIDAFVASRTGAGISEPRDDGEDAPLQP